MYALTTQASEVSENLRSDLIDGSATLTIVVSSTIIRTPRHSTISANQRRSRCDGGAAAAAVSDSSDGFMDGIPRWVDISTSNGRRGNRQPRRSLLRRP